MRIEINTNLIGSILDIGGGGDGVIGQIFRDKVTAIDNRQEELDETPDLGTKMLMDAEALLFPDRSFDNVTFFYSLMYMTKETQQKAIREAARVLKPGGLMLIWDCDIRSAYPYLFMVDLEIISGQTVIRTTYGIVKTDPQNLDSILNFLRDAGLRVDHAEKENGQFFIRCGKE